MMRLFMSGSGVTRQRTSWPSELDRGAVRALEHLTHVTIEAEMVPLRNNVVIPFAPKRSAGTGQLRDHRTSAAAEILLDELAWWGTTLKQARSGEHCRQRWCASRPRRKEHGKERGLAVVSR
jgi:hypothetical protein